MSDRIGFHPRDPSGQKVELVNKYKNAGTINAFNISCQGKRFKFPRSVPILMKVIGWALLIYVVWSEKWKTYGGTNE